MSKYHYRKSSLFEMWGRGGGGSINLEKTIVSARATTLNGKAQVQEGLRSCTEDQNQIQTSSWYETIHPY